MIDKIIDKLISWTGGYYNFLHILFSMIITLELRQQFNLSGWISGLIVLGLGIAKEVYDKVSKKGTASWKDIIYDVIGIILGMI